jgi:hypothetical protein
MSCPEYTRLAALVANKRHAYAYIRLNQGRVHLSERRYQELVSEGYAAMTDAMKEFGWHKMNCRVCRQTALQV